MIRMQPDTPVLPKEKPKTVPSPRPAPTRQPAPSPITPPRERPSPDFEPVPGVCPIKEHAWTDPLIMPSFK